MDLYDLIECMLIIINLIYLTWAKFLQPDKDKS